ncbi:MAG: class I SAM-dependent methyltransferase [Rhodospirillales bacterium]
MSEKSDNLSIQAEVRRTLDKQERILLGHRSSHELETDPRHLLFVLARYKFVAKLLTKTGTLLEVGAGDGLGASIVAQAGNSVVGIDLEPLGMDAFTQTTWTRERGAFHQHDIVAAPFQPDGALFDGAYSLDVIEHIHPDQEALFMANIVASLKPTAALIIGTPNESAKAYASKQALEQHINWKSMSSLQETCQRHFANVFMFGMNDEVVHTGYSEMCHYLFALCTTRK